MATKFEGAAQRRVNLNMRCTPDLRSMVEAAAAMSGRSLTDEVLWRVERSFYTDDFNTVIRETVREEMRAEFEGRRAMEAQRVALIANEARQLNAKQGGVSMQQMAAIEAQYRVPTHVAGTPV
jgi:hypothetical protein